MWQSYLKDESGATAMEYGLIAALISVSVIAGYKAIGTSLNNQWDTTSTTLSGAGSQFLGNK